MKFRDIGRCVVLALLLCWASPARAAIEASRVLFDAWVADEMGLSGNDALPGATPYKDGVKNILKYAFNMRGDLPDTHTMQPGGLSGLPNFRLVQEAGGPCFRAEYVRRRNSGLTYVAKRSNSLDLSSFKEMEGTTTVTTINNQWERVVVLQPVNPAVAGMNFGILSVSLPEADSTVDGDGVGITDPAAFRAALGLSEIDNVSGKPDRLWKTMLKLAQDRQGNKPVVIRTLTIGDSTALNADDLLKEKFGIYGSVVGPRNTELVGSAIREAGRSNYAASPFGNCSVLPSAGDAVIWGNYNGGSGRFPVCRYISVMYEAVAGAGSFRVEYETSAGTWATIGNINANNSGPSKMTIWEFGPVAPALTTRIRAVSTGGGTVRILWAATSMSAGNEPVSYLNRGGVMSCGVGEGGSRAEEWNLTPQEIWNTMLGWLKPDMIFIREEAEGTVEAWGPQIEALVNKLRIARPQADIIMIGHHPQGPDGKAAEPYDNWMKAYCQREQLLFIDMRQYFPETMEESKALGLSRPGGDYSHLTVYGDIYAQGIIYDHLTPIKTWPVKPGANSIFTVLHDGNVEGALLGFARSNGYTGNNDNTFGLFENPSNIPYPMAEGLTFRYAGDNFANVGTSGHFFLKRPSPTLLARPFSGRLESWSGDAATVPMIASGISSQTANLLEIRTDASEASPGLLAASFDRTGNLAFNSLAGIKGTDQQTSASQGNVGEHISSNVPTGGAVPLTNNTTGNVTSITLTAGDWDVEGNVNLSFNAATMTGFSCGISDTSVTLPGDGTEVYSGIARTSATTVDSITLTRKRISIPSGKVIYLVARPSFSAGNVSAFGSISARRVR